jgi:protoheme ferro-lyase
VVIPFTLIDKIRNGTDKIEKLTIEEYKPEPKFYKMLLEIITTKINEMPFNK